MARQSFIRKPKPKSKPKPKPEKEPETPKEPKPEKPKVSLPVEAPKVKFRDKTQIKVKEPELSLPEGVLVEELARFRWEAKIEWQGSRIPLGYYKERQLAIDACVSALARRRKKK